jgi:hypothetical protein
MKCLHLLAHLVAHEHKLGIDPRAKAPGILHLLVLGHSIRADNTVATAAAANLIHLRPLPGHLPIHLAGHLPIHLAGHLPRHLAGQVGRLPHIHPRR